MSHTSASNQPQYGDLSRAEQDFELAALREAILGAEYADLLAFKARLENQEDYTASVAAVVSEALTERAGQDDSVFTALESTVEGALTQSIQRDPQSLADALYPVMGPAIRKSISETFTQMFEGFNQALEQSLSPRALGWRFDAWRTGKSYSEIVLLKTTAFQVEQVFLIHKETGLLLNHQVAEFASSRDPDMVSAMLTAIQDFVSDSFATAEGDSLSRMALGDLTVLVERGPHAILATAVRGNVTADYRKLMLAALESSHQNFAQALADFDGDTDTLSGVEQCIRPCLVSVQQQQKEKKTPWLGLAAAAIVLIGIAYWLFTAWQTDQNWQQTIATFQSEPGLIVLGHEHSNGKGTVVGLRDSLARPTSAILADSPAQSLDMDFQWRDYVSMDRPIRFQRIESHLNPPASVSMSLDGEVLSVSGSAHPRWYDRAKSISLELAGVNTVDLSSVEQVDPLARQINSLLQAINASELLFASGESMLDADAEAMVQSVARKIKRLDALLVSNSPLLGSAPGSAGSDHLKVTLTGRTDASGSRRLNEKLASARAAAVTDGLAAAGVASNFMRSATSLSDAADTQASNAESKRRVTVSARVTMTGSTP